MSALKRSMLHLGFRAGVFRLAQLARQRQAFILTFHRFSEDEGAGRGLPIRKLAQYMEYLTRHYRVVSLGEMVEDLRRGVVRPLSTAVTVDDGYQDFFSMAAPVFRRYGVPASVFVVSDFINGRLWLWTDRFRFVFERAARSLVTFGHRGRIYLLDLQDDESRVVARERCVEYAKGIRVAEREELLTAIAEACGVTIPVAPPQGYQPMSWAQLRSLAAEGFEMGAHTRTHPILSQVGPAQLRDEIEGCKEDIERNLGVPVRLFAYPNGLRGNYGPEALEVLSKARYLAAVTTNAGGNTPSTPHYELNRISLCSEDLVHFAQHVSGFEFAKRRFATSFGLDRMLAWRQPPACQGLALGPVVPSPAHDAAGGGPEELGAADRAPRHEAVGPRA